MAESDQEVYHFRSRPGPRERRLKRFHRNRLFPETLRRVSQREVNAARQRDLADLAEFERRFEALVRSAMDLPPNADSDVVLALKEEGERLYELAAGLGGEIEASKQGLGRLLGVIHAAIERAAAGDSMALATLEDERQARERHHGLLEHVLIADVLAAPVSGENEQEQALIEADELAAVVLSDSPQAVSALVGLFDDVQARALLDQARECLADAGFGDEIPKDVWAAFEALSSATDAKSAHLDDFDEGACGLSGKGVLR